ncbi:MAG: glycyl-radical enzyme activating protein, partial [Clostridioides difficile]|nr:glycyl-radical enzyme activating protein [Clostridioides difficile]
LLPFHRLGESKWIQLGKEYEYSDKGDVDEGHLGELQDIFLDNGIACYVGHETAF